MVTNYDLTNLDLFFSKTSTDRGPALYKEKMVFEADKEYLVRLLPYVKGTEEEVQTKTVFRYFSYAWKSKTGKWTYVQSPRTYGEQCPVTDWYFQLKNVNPKKFQEMFDTKRLPSYREQCYYNVYVVNDPVNPANNGKVKILQAGTQINDIIKAACTSDPAKQREFYEEYEVKNMKRAIFGLESDGLNLNIKVESQGNFLNYKSSSFTRRKRDLNLTDEEKHEIYKSCFDLSTVDRRQTVEEVAEKFKETYPYYDLLTLSKAEVMGYSNRDDIDSVTSVVEESIPSAAMPTDSTMCDVSRITEFLNRSKSNPNG